MSDHNGTPANMDLDAILRTLASLQKPEEGHHQQQPFQIQDYPPQQQPQQRQYTPDPRLAGRTKPPQPVPNPQPRSSTPLIDPATIIDWKQGLRCVSKIAAQNPQFAVSVRKLIKDQEGNVSQWEAGRTRLVEEQSGKRENERAHRAALSLPGLLENTPALRTPEREREEREREEREREEREREELDQYDAKVYRASKAMVDVQSSSLKVLGVPFFGVRPHLLASEDEEIAANADGSPVKVTQGQVLELQRRMLTHLLDLYGD